MGFENLLAFLCLIYSALFIGIILVRIKKLPATLVAILLIQSTLEEIRAILYFSSGNYGQHFNSIDSNLYVSAQFIETTFMFFLIFLFRKFPDPIEAYISIYNKNDKTPIAAYLFFQVILIGISFTIAGNNWIHGNRVTTMSIANPQIRYIFPALLFSASIVSVYSLKYIFINRGYSKLTPLILMFWSAFIFMLIGQRGLVITLSVATIIGLYKIDKISIKSICIIFSILLFYGLFSRSVIDGTFGIDSLLSVSDIFLRGGDGTKLDSIAFAIFNRPLLGAVSLSILHELITFIPHQVRIDQGIPTVSDFLNTEAVGDYYYNFGNGFNFSNISTFIVLYGVFSPLICIFLACIYKYLFKNLIKSNRSADTTFVYILFLLFFIESIGSIHWIIYSIAMIFGVRFFSGLLLGTK